MFSFLNRSTPRSPSAAVRRALDKDGLPPGIGKASLLRVVQSRGRCSDRKVTYIRVFDPIRAGERHLTVREFSDLDAYPGLILKAGHIEPDGIVVITRRWPAPNCDKAIQPQTGPVAVGGDSRATSGSSALGAPS